MSRTKKEHMEEIAKHMPTFAHYFQLADQELLLSLRRASGETEKDFNRERINELLAYASAYSADFYCKVFQYTTVTFALETEMLAFAAKAVEGLHTEIKKSIRQEFHRRRTRGEQTEKTT